MRCMWSSLVKWPAGLVIPLVFSVYSGKLFWKQMWEHQKGSDMCHKVALVEIICTRVWGEVRHAVLYASILQQSAFRLIRTLWWHKKHHSRWSEHASTNLISGDDQRTLSTYPNGQIKLAKNKTWTNSIRNLMRMLQCLLPTPLDTTVDDFNLCSHGGF